MQLTAEQCKAARALLGWTRKALAAASRVAERTLADFEGGVRQPRERTLIDIRRTLEEAGVACLDEDEDGGPGVRLKVRRRGGFD
jgi:transcriptional regulator with XRE-family HTH domain